MMCEYCTSDNTTLELECVGDGNQSHILIQKMRLSSMVSTC